MCEILHFFIKRAPFSGAPGPNKRYHTFLIESVYSKRVNLLDDLHFSRVYAYNLCFLRRKRLKMTIFDQKLHCLGGAEGPLK